jgi:hypothetical protein
MILLAKVGAIPGQQLSAAAAIDVTSHKAGDQAVPFSFYHHFENGTVGSRAYPMRSVSPPRLESTDARIQEFLDPVLAGEVRDLQWIPHSWCWN